MATVDRARAVRRNTILLAAAQGLIQVAFPVMLVVGSVAAVDLTGRDSAAGILVAVYFVAAAAGAFGIGRAMDRLGRRPGLVGAYLFVGAAGVGGALAVRWEPHPVLLACTVLFGLGSGGANLARAAVADMYPAEGRGRAVGYLLAAGTVGAVGSPLLIAFLQRLAEHRLRMDPHVLPWVLVLVGAAGAMACVLAVRPDPRDLAVAAPEVVRPDGAPDRRPQDLFRLSAFRTAVVAAAVGQMAMVAVMGVTPVALHHHGDSSAAISGVISLHIAGMFAFSPLIGAALDRWGRHPGLLLGAAMSGVGALVASTAADAWLVGVGLFAIGLGWSATYLGATAVISDIMAPSERGGALGFTDLLISASSAGAGLAAGFVFEGAGFRVLGIAVAVLVAPVLLTLLRLRDAAPAARIAEMVLDE